MACQRLLRPQFFDVVTCRIEKRITALEEFQKLGVDFQKHYPTNGIIKSTRLAI